MGDGREERKRRGDERELEEASCVEGRREEGRTGGKGRREGWGKQSL